jgi:hypothetical protein
MNWKRRMRRNFLFALLAGVAATAFYFGLLFTRTLHGFAAGALGPAANFLWRLDPNCQTPVRCNLEELAVNVVLYAFWIFVALVGIDLLRQLKRKLAR